VPFYRSWQKLDPGAGYPLERRYAALPVLTKKDIRNHFPPGMIPEGKNLDQALERNEVSLVETSGTTDEKVTNIWNQTWWDASEKSSWQLNSIMAAVATGQHPEAILVNPKNVGIKSDNADLPMDKRQLGRYLYLNEKTDPLAWSAALMDRMVEELNTFQPVVLEGNPSYLARLARYIANHNKMVYQPPVIVFTYEYPTVFHRRQISSVFKSHLISSYGTTETGYVFMQCEKGILHQNSDYCHVDYQPLSGTTGGPLLGRILVTPLGNPWCYYLRFDTGDLVQLESSAQCPCGRSSGIILSAIAGRKVNLTLTTTGRPVTLLELDSKMGELEGIQEYQLIQPSPKEYTLVLAGDRLFRTGVGLRATALLKSLYGRDADINIKYEQDIVPEESGKYLVAKALFPIDLEQYLQKSEIRAIKLE
jgi:phenylacetate-coenzyme A ligase PaaK-like adenylate-forming protein